MLLKTHTINHTFAHTFSLNNLPSSDTLYDKSWRIDTSILTKTWRFKNMDKNGIDYYMDKHSLTYIVE